MQKQLEQILNYLSSHIIDDYKEENIKNINILENADKKIKEDYDTFLYKIKINYDYELIEEYIPFMTKWGLTQENIYDFFNELGHLSTYYLLQLESELKTATKHTEKTEYEFLTAKCDLDAIIGIMVNLSCFSYIEIKELNNIRLYGNKNVINIFKVYTDYVEHVFISNHNPEAKPRDWTFDPDNIKGRKYGDVPETYPIKWNKASNDYKSLDKVMSRAVNRVKNKRYLPAIFVDKYVPAAIKQKYLHVPVYEEPDDYTDQNNQEYEGEVIPTHLPTNILHTPDHIKPDVKKQNDNSYTQDVDFIDPRHLPANKKPIESDIESNKNRSSSKNNARSDYNKSVVPPIQVSSIKSTGKFLLDW